MRKVLAGAVILVFGLFLLSASNVLAQIDYCEGNFDNDQDVDGGDAALFKSDFGRSQFSNPCPPDGPAPVPKTGQTTVYGPRDDGYWQQALGVEWPNPRFTDNGDGTVTDNLTELIWLQNANCFNGRPWEDAILDCIGLSDGECGLTDGSIMGDWRLPNKFELQSLLDLSRAHPAIPAVHPFTNVVNAFYWTSTTTAFDTTWAWWVVIDSGYSLYGTKLHPYLVWPVRGGR